MRRVAFILVSLFCAASAHAELITFEYTAIIHTLHEVGPGVNGYVESSIAIPDGVRVGDNFHGAFTINTDLPLFSATSQSASYRNMWPDLLDAPSSSIVFDKTGASFSSRAEAPNISVIHAPGTYDHLNISPPQNIYDWFSFDFHDPNSASLSGLSIPSNINLSTWSSADVSLHLMDWGTDISLNMSGILTSVTNVSAVPEPETYAMLLAGLALVSGVAAYRKRLA